MDGLGQITGETMNDAPELSVVIPFFNEAPNVASLLGEVREALAKINVPSEVIAVDDGSSDGTGAALAEAAQRWPELRVERFARNRGQAAALYHGFRRARGSWIGMLDGDGQNPPAELARLWALRTTADMIAGARTGRKDTALRRAMSRVANATRRALLRDGVSDSGCSLKLFRREVVDSFLPIRTMYSFLPAFAVAGGWSVCEVPVAHRPRHAGASKYGLRAMAVLPLLDLLSLCWILRRTVRQKASQSASRA
jgi:glycosyltransferase involved in cell wall biosynthesis